MSMAELEPSQSPTLRKFFGASFLLHAAVFLFFILGTGIFGVEGPGGGEALTFQLAAGAGNEMDAAADIDMASDNMPTFADADVDPVPVIEPEVVPEPPKKKPKPKALPKRKAETKPTKKKTTPVVGEAKTAKAGSVAGTVGKKTTGGGGDAPVTILNKRGNSLTGGDFGARFVGRTLNLDIGRPDVQGGNRLPKVSIELNADGTSDVEVVQYLYQTLHSTYSSTRTRSGKGKWWIKGNLFCHMSKVIEYGTRDCYHLTMDGSVLRMYYDRCTYQSSRDCKPGRESGFGRVN
ncbi:MAG: hypothetical protein KUG61_03960 [Parvibaculaceae bacterium]|nr:hypothetical protein [Parvibaculaceae bacterium]